MIPIYIIILIAFINSKDFQILDLEPNKYRYYAKDMIQSKEDILIYKFEPKAEKKNIFLLFLGHSNDGSFEFYLYEELSDIKYDDNKNFINFLEKLNNYGEININHNLDVYYILIRMNSYEDKYDYLSFMIYNSEEYWDIGKLEINQEYILAFEKDKDIIFTYPSKNITQILYLSIIGDCDEISYAIYKNNTEPESIDKVIHYCYENHYKILTLTRNNNYYIKLSFVNDRNKILRFIFYFLTNKKNIIEIKDYRTDMKYGYASYLNGDIEGIDKFFFINITDLPINQLIGYSLFEPFNSLKYMYWVKRYETYDIDELPNGNDVKDFDYDNYWYRNMKDEPFIFVRRYEEGNKGLFIKISSYLNENNNQVIHNEMIVYLYVKNVFDLTENHKFNHTELTKKNVFYLDKMKGKFIMKSNLDYFTILYPRRERVWSKTYLFESVNFIFELQNSENASVEFQYVKEPIISNLSSPYIMFLCNNNTQEEKFIYLPYMTNFNILFGDIKVYDIDVSLLNSLDDFYDENYMKSYNSFKRYDNYLSLKDERFFYKIKCNKYSLIKFEDSFSSYIDENITINQSSKKLILDFSRYDQKKINFQSNLSLYIGILNSQELSENWSLNFYINDETYSLNNTNNIFFHEFKTNDTLKIEKPDNNIHPYINVIYNYTIEKLRPLRTNNSGIFVFDKNISEEYNLLINISNNNYYYSKLVKYSLFYGDPKNYEYNQLISYPIEISINPYQYLENNDENKYFFILYQNYSDFNRDEFRLLKLSRKYIQLNELTLIDKIENEYVILYLPKVKETTHAFIQYFYEEMDVYKDGEKLWPKYNYYYTNEENNVKEYSFYEDREYYAGNDNISAAYKSFFLVSYVDKDYYSDDSNYRYACNFKIKNINDVLNDIKIEIYNYCSTTFHYYIFIFYNTSNDYNNMSPLELFNAKKNNNSIKCYEFTTKKKKIEILDTFEKGLMNITVVGQNTEGFRRFVFDKQEYNYIGKKKSNLTYIILGCVGGAIIILIIIFLVVRYIKKRKMYSYFKNKTKKTLLNKEEEKTKKNEIKSADFDYIISGTTDTPTSTPM